MLGQTKFQVRDRKAFRKRSKSLQTGTQVYKRPQKLNKNSTLVKLRPLIISKRPRRENLRKALLKHT
jgi:hypothetical protein